MAGAGGSDRHLHRLKKTPDHTPRPLKAGDRVALIAPAGFVSPERLAAAIRYLESLGLSVVTHLPRKPIRYLAGSDEQRADEFLDFWHDRTISALFPIRGGFGCTRILNLIGSRPGSPAKLFAGFSDNTVLHQVLASQGVSWTIHGPHPGSFGQPEHTPTRRRYEALLFGKIQQGFRLGPARLIAGKPKTTISGRLQGGNLAVMASMCGGPLKLDLGDILFLEDINEPPYRIDAFLTQLRNAGAFRSVRAIVTGDFTPPKGARRYHPALRDLWLSLSKELSLPVFSGFPAGHGRRNLALPLGVRVALLDDCMSVVSVPWRNA